MHQVNKNMSHVSDLQLEDLPGVEQHLITKLKRAGIQSVLDLAVSIPYELALGSNADRGAVAADTETISEAVLKAKKVLIESGALIKEFSTADQVLERRKALVRFTTGSTSCKFSYLHADILTNGRCVHP